MLKMPRFIPILLGFILFGCQTTGASANGSEIPNRSDIPAEYKWHLEDIYATDELWQADLEKLKTKLPEVEKYKGTLGESSQNLVSCLKARDELGMLSDKIYTYARMRRDENTADTKYQALADKAETIIAAAGAAVSYIDPEILALPEATLTKYCRENPALNEYQFYFDNLIRQKSHVLSPAEEKILSYSAEVTQGPENIYNMLTHADLKFPEVTDEQGKTVQLSEGRYSTLISAENRKVRQQAFHNLYTTYNQYRNTFAATLSGNVKKNIFYAKIRKYDSALASALAADNVPPEVYNNLITTVNNNLQPLHKYIALRKKVLKLNDLHMYDLYTPLVPDAKLSIPYEQGLTMVKNALQPLGPEYNQALTRGLASGWIDVYENRGKQTGAYSWGSYGVHPFVLLNYHNRYEDVSTVAHEMGHALHTFFSEANQPYITAGYTTFCAEVASTTNEVLLLEYMLKTTTDKRQRLYLINQYLEQIKGTVYRQTMFAEFEKTIYEMAEQGESLTTDTLDSLWHKLNIKYYGPDIVVDKDIDVEWARIPHFYWDFYVYKYVTGYSAAATLAEKILTGGPAAQERYLNYLKSGSSAYSLDLLKQAGVDMSSPEPIELTLNKFSKLVDEMENLLTVDRHQE